MRGATWLGGERTALLILYCGYSNPDDESMTAGQQTRSDDWQSAIIRLQEVEPAFVPAGAHAMTVVVEFPPGDPGNPPHRHSGLCSAMCWRARWCSS